MTQDRKTDEKVVQFVQNGNKMKFFRKKIPLSDELKQVLIGEVFPDFSDYALTHYSELYQPNLTKFIDDMF